MSVLQNSVLSKCAAALAIALSAPAISAPSHGDAASNMHDVQTYFAHCIQSPADARGTKTAFYFSLKSDGQIFGQPRIQWAGSRSQDNRDHIISEFRDAFQHCLPLVLDQDMARTIPGKVYFLQFTVGQDGTEVRLRPYGSMGPPLVDGLHHR